MITKITNKKNLLMLLLLISCSVHVMAQTDYYYYYKGMQMPLTLNEDKVVVNIPKDSVEASERIRANVQVLVDILDQVFDIFVISKSDFENLITMETWEQDAKSVVLTSCYITDRNYEVYETPYLNVRLKKEQDIDLLESCAKEYKLKIDRNNAFLPFWYILSLTLETNKGSLQCANELYETGYFQESQADFAGFDSLVDDTTPVRGITSSLQKSGTYDLQGRKIVNHQLSNSKMQRGIYIEDGKKKVK